MRVTPALRTLVAAAFVVLAVGAPVAAAPAHGSGSAVARADGDEVVFTGRFVREPRSAVDGATVVWRYEVAVDTVFGEVDVQRRRATVQAPVRLDLCPSDGGRTPSGSATGGAGGQEQGGAGQEQAQPGGTPAAPTTTPGTSPSSAPPTEPSQDDFKALRAFRTTSSGDRYLVAGCAEVRPATALLLQQLAATPGNARPPGSDEPAPEPDREEVGYLCPGTRDALDVDDTSTCAALEDDQSFDRAAAPGLALVIVGILGLLLARRMGRPRPR